MQVEPMMQRDATFRHSSPPEGVPPPSSHPAGILFPLMAQIEFYFSPQNLAKDTFLQQQLSATEHLGAVSVDIICGFPKVKQLHAQLRHLIPMPSHLTPNADPYVVCAALQYSNSVGVSHDGHWIVPKRPQQASPTMATERTSATTSTVSSPASQASSSASSVGVPAHPLPPPAASVSTSNLRVLRVSNVPTGAGCDELMGLFVDHNTKPTGAQLDRSTMPNSWLISFETAEHAKAAVEASEGISLRGSAVQVELVKAPSTTFLPTNLQTYGAGYSSQDESHFPTQQYRVPSNTMYMSMPQYPTAQVVGYGYVPYTYPPYGSYATPYKPTQRSTNPRHPPSTQNNTQGNPPRQVLVSPQGQGSMDTTSDGQKKSRKRRGRQSTYPRQLVEQSNGDTPQPSVNQSTSTSNRGAKAPGPTVKAPVTTTTTTTSTKPQPKAVTPVKIDLGTDNFPALGGKMTSPGPHVTPQGGAYAKALMRPLPVSPEPCAPDAGVTVSTKDDKLEVAMNDMKI